jgi:GH35 family endo-1,4-beta-xylanase
MHTQIYYQAVKAALALCLILSQTASADNLITNPGFESGTTGWSACGGSFTTSTVIYRSGNQSGYAYSRTGTWNGIRQSLLGKMTPGKTYYISGWMKIEGTPDCNINVTIVKTDDSGTTYTWVDWTKGYDNCWTQLKGPYTLDVTGALTELAIYFEGPPADVNYYLDDVNVADTTDWKQEANAQIEQIRKRDAHITVVNPSGRPISDVNVQIQQTKHLFAFGSAINYLVLSDANYANFFKNHFEWAVMENESKWYSNEPTQGNVTYTTADNIYNWCEANKIIMRGHCIYWEAESVVQDWIKNLSYAPLPATSPLRTAVENRMNSAVNHFKGKFLHWDVDNEMCNNSFYADRLGYSIRPWMFQAAHAIDPDCLLFLNDYNVINGGYNLDSYKQMAYDLDAQGAPLHGLGVQCHMTTGFSIDTVKARFDSVAEVNLPIWVTEFDDSQPDENIRADELENFYRVAFSHPAVNGILMWGFWQSSMWRSDAYIVNSDWSLNAAGQRYKALMNEWTTKDSNTTDPNGKAGFRGFHGTYEITLTIAGKTPEVKVIELQLGATPAEFTVVMDTSGEPNDCNEVQAGNHRLAADLNGDCYVDWQDLDIMAEYWLNTNCGSSNNCNGADFEPRDGIVNFYDFSDFAEQWMQCNNPQDANCS